MARSALDPVLTEDTMLSDRPDPGANLRLLGNPPAEAAIAAASPLSIGPGSLALYARWWQLETWLRELVYVELRARHGVGWLDVVRVASGRQTLDATFTHMLSADTDNPLAYLDYSQLVSLIDANWDLCSYALLERASWNGRQAELARIRHRIGHCRKPHADDLGRLEQTLRDLERGRFIAHASYNDARSQLGGGHSGRVVRDWQHGEHETAQRLVEHASRQYETRIKVSLSRRPWAPRASGRAHRHGCSTGPGPGCRRALQSRCAPRGTLAVQDSTVKPDYADVGSSERAERGSRHERTVGTHPGGANRAFGPASIRSSGSELDNLWRGW